MSHPFDPPRLLPVADDARLDAALAEAYVGPLLLTYVHLTHDEEMLDRFAPHLPVAHLQKPELVPAELLAELRARLRDVLTGTVPAVGTEPSDALYQRMMSVGVGEPVEDEFVPLLFDQIGLRVPPSPATDPARPTPPQDLPVVVIGLGLTGIVAAIKLLEAGHRVVVLERNEDLGGTWLTNTYPGVGVDTPSHFYSYSLAQWSDWTHFKPKGEEMHRYFSAVVDAYGLRDHTRFGERVESCHWDDASGVWEVRHRSADGTDHRITARAVVNAMGFSQRAKDPDIPGLDTFAGARVHTARWDPSLDLAGARVAVIGTGASGVQVVPAIADDAAHVTVFMRRRHWVLNNRETDIPVSPGHLHAIRTFPHYREWLRFRVYWIAGDGNYQRVLLDPDWEGNPLAVSAGNEQMRQFALRQMEAELGDRPDLLAKVTPDFPIYAKRIISHPSWWETLRRDDVELVVEPITAAEPGGLRTADGVLHEADVLVLATGFDFPRMHGDLDVRGRDGRSLAAEWGDDDPRSYMGVLVPGFPNYFHMNGPNSGPNFAGGVNIIAECQAHYVVACLEHARTHGGSALEPTDEAFEAWNAEVDEQLTRMIWSHPGSDSYYLNSRRRPYMSWPFRLVDYWHRTRGPVPADVRVLP